jgi:hypothetical protein
MPLPCRTQIDHRFLKAGSWNSHFRRNIMADTGDFRVTLQLVAMAPAGEAVADNLGLVTVERVIVNPERQSRAVFQKGEFK